MLCSIIIPTINRPSLERAVKSVLAQALPDGQYEIIVVNDSGRPLPETDWLAAPAVKILQTNRCERSVACNTGAAVATGKYLKILHDDDYLAPGGLRALIEVAESSGCYWVHGVLNRVDDNDLFMSTSLADINGNVFALSFAGETIHLGQSLILRKAFFQVGGFDPTLKTTEDRDLQCRIALLSNFARTDQLVVNVRIGTGSKSTTDWSRATAENRIIREKMLTATGAWQNIVAGVRSNVHVRGRCCRAYFLSAALNLSAGRIFIGLSRAVAGLRLMGPYLVFADFWRGITYRSYWHQVEKQREAAHYAAHQTTSTQKSLISQ